MGGGIQRFQSSVGPVRRLVGCGDDLRRRVPGGVDITLVDRLVAGLVEQLQHFLADVLAVARRDGARIPLRIDRVQTFFCRPIIGCGDRHRIVQHDDFFHAADGERGLGIHGSQRSARHRCRRYRRQYHPIHVHVDPVLRRGRGLRFGIPAREGCAEDPPLALRLERHVRGSLHSRGRLAQFKVTQAPPGGRMRDAPAPRDGLVHGHGPCRSRGVAQQLPGIRTELPQGLIGPADRGSPHRRLVTEQQIPER